MENESNGSTRRERDRFRLAAEILDAAAELFASFGYEGTSVKQIAERAELSVGKIYNHREQGRDIQGAPRQIYDSDPYAWGRCMQAG